MHSRPFLISEARDAGLSRRTLRGARFRAIARGVYIGGARVARDLGSSDAVDPSRGHDRYKLDGPSTVRSAGRHRTSTPLCHHTPPPDPAMDVQVTRVSRLPQHRNQIAIPEHSWMVAAGHLNLLELVTAGDWLLRSRRTTLAELESYVRSNSGRGCRSARAAIGMVRERLDSPRETWLRLCLVLAGLPAPECNVVIGDDRGPNRPRRPRLSRIQDHH